MIYAKPGTEGAVVSFKPRYQNYIGGQWVEPTNGQYFTNTSPCTGDVIAEIPRSEAADIELALDAAHKAKDAWGTTSVTERSNILLQVADRIEANLEMLAVAETWENGKAVRETLAADIPLCVDHFRYFAGCIRAQEGTAAELDANTVAYHIPEPLGVVGQIIPWNFPLLMAAWKIAPALAAGNCIVLKPAEQTPTTILLLMEVIGDLLPPGVLNVVNGMGPEAGQALATSKRIAKIAFTGSTAIGNHVLRCAADNLIPSTVELGASLQMCTSKTSWNRKRRLLRKRQKEQFWHFSTRAKSVPVLPDCLSRKAFTMHLWIGSWRKRKLSSTAIL